jgi:CDP-archaeol synthase
MGSVARTAGEVLYLFLPLLASMALAGVVLRYDLLPELKQPIDGGAVVRGHRLFGDNKTWRGLVTSAVGCTAVVAVQKWIGDRAGRFALIDYGEVNVFALGAALGLSAIVGELPNSFLKRQLGLAPGEHGSGIWGTILYVLDQIDWLLIVWPVLLIWIRPGWSLVLTSLVLAFFGHQLISLLGYQIGARRTAA